MDIYFFFFKVLHANVSKTDLSSEELLDNPTFPYIAFNPKILIPPPFDVLLLFLLGDRLQTGTAAWSFSNAFIRAC